MARHKRRGNKVSRRRRLLDNEEQQKKEAKIPSMRKQLRDKASLNLSAAFAATNDDDPLDNYQEEDFTLEKMAAVDIYTADEQEYVITYRQARWLLKYFIRTIKKPGSDEDYDNKEATAIIERCVNRYEIFANHIFRLSGDDTELSFFVQMGKYFGNVQMF